MRLGSSLKGYFPGVISHPISGGGHWLLRLHAAAPFWCPVVVWAVSPCPRAPLGASLCSWRAGTRPANAAAESCLRTRCSIFDFAPLFSLLMWFCLFLQVSQSAPSPDCLYFWKAFCLVPVIPLTSSRCSGLPLPAAPPGLNWDLFQY